MCWLGVLKRVCPNTLSLVINRAIEIYRSCSNINFEIEKKRNVWTIWRAFLQEILIGAHNFCYYIAFRIFSYYSFSEYCMSRRYSPISLLKLEKLRIRIDRRHFILVFLCHTCSSPVSSELWKNCYRTWDTWEKNLREPKCKG